MTTINQEKNDPNNILHIRTKKISVIKSVIESLKDILSDACIKFIPQKEINGKNIGGISIAALNSSMTIYVKVRLDAEKFEYYYCEPDGQQSHISIGVNMTNFFKIIKVLNNDDELSIIYNKKTKDSLNLKYYNINRKCESDYDLKLLEVADLQPDMPSQVVNYKITMPSGEFHKLIKDMSSLSDCVSIIFTKENNEYTLLFKCDGEIAKQQTKYKNSVVNQRDEDAIILTECISEKKETDKKVNNKYNDNIMLQGVYELSSLLSFSKCAPLCPNIDIHIRNNAPLIIKYYLADMGSIILMVSNKKPENVDDSEDSETVSESDE